MFWYIDTFDASSGRAFTSYRLENLLDAESLDDSEVTFFLEPPAFDPIQVNRAVAFAAMRFQFQEGLFDGDGEVPFRELADVAEFVRRSYLRRGGGDGGGEGGGGGEPPPEGPPSPEDPDRSGKARGDSGVDPLPGLRTIAKEFQERSRTAQRGSAETVEFVQAEPVGSGLLSQARLARGALWVALEQIRVFSKSSAKETLAQQRSNMQRLFNIIIGSGLGPEFHSTAEKYHGLPRWLLTQFRRIGASIPFGAIDDHNPLVAGLILPFLATGGYPNGDWHEAIEWHFFNRSQCWYGVQFTQIEDDPVDLLGRLSVPQDIAKTYARRSGEPVSLDQLLFSFLAAPQLCVSDAGTPMDASIELALFASACIVLPPTLRKYPGQIQWRHDHVSEKNLVASEMERWLRANLPTRFFSATIEDLLAKPDQFAKAVAA